MKKNSLTHSLTKKEDFKTFCEVFKDYYKSCSGDLDDKYFDLNVCLEELVINIFDYGFKRIKRTPDVAILIEKDCNNYVVTITDNATPFNPLTQTYDPVLAANLESCKIGGIGIHLIKNLSDKFNYYPMENGNKIILHKNY